MKLKWIMPLLLLCLCSCNIGARSVPQDRFDYSEAISSSWKQQMLVNMVKLRYGDAPVFLDVASVINQYSIETQVDARFGWSDAPALGDSQSVGGSAKYGDKPTITYTPLAGARFARSLMKPIPPPAILSLIQAGYPIDLVLRSCTHCINGVRNRYGGSARARPADPEFYVLLSKLRRLQDSGVLGMRVQKTGEMEGVVMTIRGKMDASLEADTVAVRKLLGLDVNAKELRIVYGSVASDDKEIAMLSRSVLEILIDLASNFDVPPMHVTEKRVLPTMPFDVADGTEVPPLVRTRTSTTKPSDSFIAVPYRDNWYWIDDRDLRSKSAFTFLMFIFSLTETEGKEGAPIVTIPAG